MQVNRLLYVEDSVEKYMDVAGFLRRYNFLHIDWVTNAEKAVAIIDDAEKDGKPFDLIISDMHFDFFGVDEHDAGEKLLRLIREKGYQIPFIFCSSQNWKISESIGNIFYNPRRNWEDDAEKLFKELQII